MTAPEKAAPIPAEVLAKQYAAKACVGAWTVEEAVLNAIRADREARPSLPDSREERDSPANLAKRVLAMREHLRHERADGVDFGTLTVVARTLTDIASADRALARQGGNNG